MGTALRLAVTLSALASTACSSLSGGADARTFKSATAEEISTAQLVQQLAEYDVVFLGELHDSDDAHALQLAVTRGLFRERGQIALSLEMFERDVQDDLDAYLAGEIDEESFLEVARPWGNYRRHYRGVIELARHNALPVLAANVPRLLARRVSREGLLAVMGEEHMPRRAHVIEDDYRERFDRAMGYDGLGEEPELLDEWYAAQCVKDDAMAESIGDFLDARGSEAPLLVHWCGRFHSDYYLGTVARLNWRNPRSRVAVVTTLRGDRRRALSAEEREAADYVWLVRR